VIRLSPRGCIFMSLEIIREPLIKIIGKELQKDSKSWWHDYIYFPAKIVNSKKKIPRAGTVNDLYKYLDELDCLNIIKKKYSLFSKYIDRKLLEDIIKSRHRCVHIFSNNKLFDNNFTNDILFKMACLMENIDKKAQETILSYRSHLNAEAVKANPVEASKETLVRFLKDRVWDETFKIFEKDDKIDRTEKTKLIENMKGTYKFINNEIDNSNDLLQWFNNQLCKPEGIYMYQKLKSYTHLEIPTFEDVRKDFYDLCGIH